jgi:hypothetical protein
MQIEELKGRIRGREYVVDPQAVAEAMLHRGRGAIAAAIMANGVSGGRSRAELAHLSGRAGELRRGPR